MIRIAALVLTLLVVASCTPTVSTPPAVGGTAAPAKVAITGETPREIEALLGKRSDALARNDLAGFQSTFDTTRPALRRCQTEVFEIASRQGSSGSGTTVAKVEPYLDHYVRAYVGSDPSGYQRLYFRQDAGRWILSEPKEEELGGDRTKTIQGMAMSYYGIDDDVIEIYAKAGTAVLAEVQSLARTPTGVPFGLRIFPTRSAAGATVGCSTGGFHLINDQKDIYVRLFSNIMLLKPGFTEVSDTTTSIIRHEALHWIQDQIVPGISARLDWWLVEGWPDYLGRSRGEAVKQRVVCTTKLPTFKQLQDGVLETPETPPELPGQYYAFANTMIQYLYEVHGDDAYYDLIAVFKDTVDARITYPKALGITGDQFYERWQVWAKQKFC